MTNIFYLFNCLFINILLVNIYLPHVYGQAQLLDASVTLSVGHRTIVDDMKFRRLLRMGRRAFFTVVKGNETTKMINESQKKGKVQRQFSADVPFFCDTNGPGKRSEEIPTSVHALTPGDIDIIGAIGDSLTAGNGALATTFAQLFIEYKGLSWAVGGKGTWRQFLTLPNILKEYNPNLYGYSTENGYAFEELSKFNVGEFGGMSRDLPYMSKILAKRIQNDPKVNLTEHWKMISVHIGGNDFCIDVCYHKDPYDTVKLHEKHLLKTLRTFRDSLPRTIVNVLMPPDVFLLTHTSPLSLGCQLSFVAECPCIFSFGEQRIFGNFQIYQDVLNEWRKVQEKVVAREEFNREDFTVILHKFTTSLELPLNDIGATDFTFLSRDCFHLSQKGNAVVATSIWNSLLDPYDDKKLTWGTVMEDFHCPTEEHPFLRTREN